MSRERAAELRAEGMTYEQIANMLGVARATPWRWLHPERTRELDSRARPEVAKRKRKWDRENRFDTCPRCGYGMKRGAKQCRDCYSKKNGV